jgi:hypothetical protein
MKAEGHERAKRGTPEICVPLERVEWLPERNDLRTTHAIIPIGYERIVKKKSVVKKKAVNGPKKHVIHKAVLWRKRLDEGKVKSFNEIAKKEGLTRARVTQIMNLLKLPSDFQQYLLRLDDPEEIRKYSERKLRNSLSDFFLTD